MSEAFSPAYSQAYDAIYHDKDYEGECDLLEALLGRFAGALVQRVVDLGCGTGNHSLVLARRGYQVVGVDRSEAMLDCARAKLPPEWAARTEFIRADIRRLDLGRRFDAALMMFAVLGYQCQDADVHAALASARRHLEPGGLLLFDVWHAPAVLQHGPSARVRRVETREGPLLRLVRGELDPVRNLCRVHIELRGASSVVAGPPEIHDVRYFFAEELRRFLSAAGFETLRAGAFPEFDREPDEGTWSVLVAARAV